ncbi:MAG: hypothetical protein LBR43_03675 [Spiroplasmataceae bacterium]|jgi:hypothetical protein|nr:hypothetical protein [Spiroplasmataceae bacterium]
MLNQEYTAKFTIKDIEPKQDKNFNPYFLVHFENSNHKLGYTFQSKMDKTSWDILKNTPYKLVNQRVNITYSFNYLTTHSFLIVKSISLIE